VGRGPATRGAVPALLRGLAVTLAVALGPGAAHASVEAGKALFAQKGCGGCHRVHGEGGEVGPDLSNEGNVPGHDRDWQIRHLMDPAAVVPGSFMPKLVQTEAEAGDLADYLLSLKAAPAPAAPAAAGPTAVPEGPAPKPPAGKPAPAPAEAAPPPPAQAAPAQSAPAQSAPAQAAPAQAAPAQAAPAQAAPAQAVPAAPEPAAAPQAASAPAPAVAASIERGAALYRAKGCPGCHMIRGSGGTLGPDLSFEGEVPGHDAAWHRRHLADPRSTSPGSTMPAFNLKPADAVDLIAFLTSRKRLAEDRALTPDLSRRFAALGTTLAGLRARVEKAHARGRNVDDLTVRLSQAWTHVGTVEEMVRRQNVVGARKEIQAAEDTATALTRTLDDFAAQLRQRIYLAAGTVAMILFGCWVLIRKIRLLTLEWNAEEAQREARRARGRKGPAAPEPAAPEGEG